MKDMDIYDLRMTTINKMMNNPKKLVNGALTIGYDFSKEKDHCCLIVAQLRGNSEVMIINEFYDEEANELFKKLVQKS
jgi:hypothetical protein